MIARVELLVVFLLSGCGLPAGDGTASPEPDRAPGGTDAAAATAGPGAQGDWQAEHAAWRREREERLSSPDGYLGLAGLWWLSPGDSRVGADPRADIVLPAGRAPLDVGTLVRDGDRVTFRAAAGARVIAGGEPVDERLLLSDADGEPTVLTIGPLELWLILRGDRLGIRMRDPESPILAAYRGTDAWEPSEAWRVRARFRPYLAPRAVAIPNVLGSTYDDASPGRLVFELDGTTHELVATGDPTSGLFVIFGDETNGVETYGGGRFLSVDGPDEDGVVLLDFNRAYNPPCSYSPFTTCPLPLPENRLPLRVEAGEKAYAAH